MANGAGARVWRSLALVASVLVMLGIVGMHMLAGGHGSKAGGWHGDTGTMSVASIEAVGHAGHGSELVAAPADEMNCGHQAAGHAECVLSLPWSVLPAATPPVAWQPIWLLARPAPPLMKWVVTVEARSSPLLLSCVCRT